MRTPKLTFCLLWFGWTAFASASQTSDPELTNGTRDAHFIAEQLRACPDWYIVPPEDVGRRREITNIYLVLAHYPTDVLRSGIALYVDSYTVSELRYVEAGYKVFAFARVVFKVPLRVRAGERQYGTLGNPVIAEGPIKYVDFLWPYSIDDAGKLILTGRGGFLSGMGYDPIADFNELSLRFERRFPSTQAGEPMRRPQ